MKKVLLFFFVSLMAISLVLAAQGSASLTGQQGNDAGSDAIQAGQGAGNGTQSNVEAQTQNQGLETSLQNQEKVRVKSGNYENSNGTQMQIQAEDGFKLKVGNAEARSSLEINQEQDQNKTKLNTQLSNGKNAEIKVMPDTASERAIERLQLKVCNSDNNCSIELKEVGSGEQVKVAYEVQAQKDARFLGLFKTKMNVQAQIDAETGEVIQSKKPWWAFLASE
jgi:opacity protein-like surface antigen